MRRHLPLLMILLIASGLRADDAVTYNRGVRELFELVRPEANAALAKSVADLRVHWLEPARAFLGGIVPKDVPRTVVYPFGGGDLLSALVTFPAAQEVTTISLEPAGEPVTQNLGKGDQERELALLRRDLDLLFRKAHSRTDNLGSLTHITLPGQLMFALAALAVLDREPVGLKYFRLAPDGRIVYVTTAEVAATRPGSSARAALFRNMELAFVPRGAAPGTPPVVHRHIAWNLDDEHVTREPALLAHLAAKGPVSAMTKAASFLLWNDGFSKIRGYLCAHAVWMLSDATGIPPKVARAAGFEQVAYGRFDGPLLGASSSITADVRALFAQAAPAPIRYGYPDSGGHNHLIVTRRRADGR